MVPELPSPPQRARAFHSHSIQTPASPFSLFHSKRRADPSKSIPPFEERPTFLWFFGWTICSSLSSSSFGGWTACSAVSPSPKPVVPSLAQVLILTRFTATGFLIHSSCPIAMDSWKFIIEVHWTWSELYWFDCSIPGVFSGRREGLGRFSWALQDPARNHPPGMPIVHTCLFPTFVGTGLSWLYCMWMMEAIGRRWSLIVHCWAAGI